MGDVVQIVARPHFEVVERWEWTSTLVIRLGRPAEGTAVALGNVIGCELPTDLNMCHGEVPRAICTGFNEWTVVGSSATPSEVEWHSGGTTTLVVQAGDGCYWIDLRGAQTLAVMSQGCSLDLHPRHFKVNQAARTLFAKLPCIIDHAQQDVFRLCFDRSYRRYVREWLETASSSFGLG